MASSLAELIAQTHTGGAAAAYRTFRPTRQDLQALAAVGADVLGHFPWMPGACAVMSAAWVARWKMSNQLPAYVVAGALRVGSARVFGCEPAGAWSEVFSRSDLSWDGHCWLAFGEYVADISIFRTAYSKESPPVLARHVERQFGRGRGLLICSLADAIQAGLYYEPQYVLSEDEVTGLLLGARSLVESKIQNSNQNKDGSAN